MLVSLSICLSPSLVYLPNSLSPFSRVICLEFCHFHSYKSHFIQFSSVLLPASSPAPSTAPAPPLFLFWFQLPFSCLPLVVCYPLMLFFALFCCRVVAVVNFYVRLFSYLLYWPCTVRETRLDVAACADCDCACSQSPLASAACHARKLLSLPIVMFCLFVCLLCACTTIWFMLLSFSSPFSLSLPVFLSLLLIYLQVNKAHKIHKLYISIL